MGIFTWYFSDRKNAKLKYGGEGYIAMPDGTFIHENCYQGYGMFGSRDAYDVVVDLNKDHLKEILDEIKKRKGSMFFEKEIYPLAVEYQEHGQDAAQDLAEKMISEGTAPGFMKWDWKRNIGIAISCDEDNNRRLPFPLKITSTDHPALSYEKLRASRSTQ